MHVEEKDVLGLVVLSGAVLYGEYEIELIMFYPTTLNIFFLIDTLYK